MITVDRLRHLMQEYRKTAEELHILLAGFPDKDSRRANLVGKRNAYRFTVSELEKHLVTNTPQQAIANTVHVLALSLAKTPTGETQYKQAVITSVAEALTIIMNELKGN